MKDGITFVVPVCNGAASIHETIDAISLQAHERPTEIIVVDDGSTDESPAILKRLAERHPIRLIKGEGRGAAAAMNLGIRGARFPIIAQVDQDVVIQPDWLRVLAAEFDNPAVGAAQGWYTGRRGARLCARAMSFDLEQRYAAIEGPETDHVCTGNAMYRADALHRIGLFDEALGYGYDNDVSYRLRAAGYQLRLCPAARSVHRWREDLAGYLVQQYGFGYGRIDVVAKHPARFGGDLVSPAPMMWHPLVLCAALALWTFALAAALVGSMWWPYAAAGTTLVAGLLLERLIAGVRAARRFHDPTPLVFPLLHLARDLAWVAAIVMWVARWLSRRPARPSHSMRPRPESGS